MSGGKLYGSDSERKVTVRVSEQLVEEYDEHCEQLDMSRSEAIRQHIRSTVAREIDDSGGMHPPTEDDLAKAYKSLLKATGPAGGYLRDNRATAQIAQNMGVDKETGWRYIQRLRERGYVSLTTDSSLRFTSIEVRA